MIKETVKRHFVFLLLATDKFMHKHIMILYVVGDLYVVAILTLTLIDIPVSPDT